MRLFSSWSGIGWQRVPFTPHPGQTDSTRLSIWVPHCLPSTICVIKNRHSPRLKIMVAASACGKLSPVKSRSPVIDECVRKPITTGQRVTFIQGNKTRGFHHAPRGPPLPRKGGNSRIIRLFPPIKNYASLYSRCDTYRSYRHYQDLQSRLASTSCIAQSPC